MPNLLYRKNLISIADLNVNELQLLLDTALQLKQQPRDDLLAGKLIASCFFEPSTRTRLSFETAVQRLGGKVIGFSDGANTSAKKGETLADTARIISSYADAIIQRHPKDGAARVLAEFSQVPVINAGDGTNQHPSQTLLDLYTILEEKGTLENLKIAFVGDLKYGRTVHSLTRALMHFNPTIYFVAPQILQMPDYLLEDLKEKNIKFEILEDFRDCLDKIDVFYMTRIQKERFPDVEDYEKVKGIYVINRKNIVGKCKDDMIILHPLPRVDEIDKDLDNTKYALYFKQAKNGIPVRQAMMMAVLGKDKEFFL